MRSGLKNGLGIRTRFGQLRTGFAGAPLVPGQHVSVRVENRAL